MILLICMFRIMQFISLLVLDVHMFWNTTICLALALAFMARQDSRQVQWEQCNIIY